MAGVQCKSLAFGYKPHQIVFNSFPQSCVILVLRLKQLKFDVKLQLSGRSRVDEAYTREPKFYISLAVDTVSQNNLRIIK
jgi:hypothetical protein